MEGLKKMFTDFIIAMAISDDIERYKGLGVTVEINIKDVDYDFIEAEAMKGVEAKKATAEAKAKENSNGIVSEDLKEFFNSKYKNEDN